VRQTLKTDLLIVLILSVGTVGLWLPRWAGPLDLRWDGAVYYTLGISLAEGKGYRLLNEPGEIEAIQVPPLLPLLAAVPLAILGTRDPVTVGQWLKRFQFSFHVSFVLASYFLLKLFTPRWLAFAGALALLFNVQVVFHSNLFFAEIPYGLATVLFFLCNRRSSRWVHQSMAAVFAVMAYALRSAGMTLFLAWIADSLAQKNFKRAAIRLLISAIPVLSWNAYVWHVQQSPAYVAPAYPYQRAPYLNHNVSYATNLALVDAFSPGSVNASAWQLTQRFGHNLLGMVVTLGEIVSDSRGFWQYELSFGSRRFPLSRTVASWLPYVPLVLLGGLSLGGMIVLLKRGEVFIPVYILTAVMLLCVTPWPEQFRRYLTPLVPFLLVCLFSCVLSIGARLRMFKSPLVRHGAPLALLLVVLTLIFDAELKALHAMYRYHLDEVRSETHDGTPVNYRLFYYPSDSTALDDGLSWLRGRVEPGEVVATSRPHWAYITKGLKAVRPPLEANPERVQALLDAVPVAYVILSSEDDVQFADDSLLPFAEGDLRIWRLIYTDTKQRVRIYQRVRSVDRGG
jgi:hypothetical protein